MNLLTKTLIGAITLTSAIAFSDQFGLASHPADRLINTSDKVNQLIRQEAFRLSQSQITEVEARLAEIRHIIRGTVNPPPPPPPMYVQFEATCEADDDPSFDWGQRVLGTARGQTVRDVLFECRQMAQATFGMNSSSGIKNLRFVGSLSPYDRTAVCWIDDDPSFDHGQIRIGEVVSHDIPSLSALCNEVARSIYGSNGSSGLTDIR